MVLYGYNLFATILFYFCSHAFALMALVWKNKANFVFFLLL